MAKSATQKRRREAEADQERRQESNGDSHTDTASVSAEPPTKKARVEERRSLFVRSLPASATTETLTAFFSEHFPVKHATVVTDPKTKASRGYGFVTFTDAEDAAAAKQQLDNQLLDGRRLRLDLAEPRSRPIARGGQSGASAQPTASAAAAAADKKKQREEELAAARRAPKLIVRNLPWSVKTSEDLTALFRMYGKVKFADLPKQKGKLAGFGFVTLRGRKNAENAIEGVNGKSVDGRTLAVDWAVDKQKWEALQQKEQEQEDEEMADEDVASEAKAPKKDKAATEPKTAEEEQLDEDLRNFMKNNLENLEEEDDDDDDDDNDDDSDSDKEEDDDEEDEEKDWEDEDDEEDDEEDEEDAKPKKVLSTDNSTTLFVRNLPFSSTDADLKAHFAQFGPVRYARIVVDRATDRPAGTGFVCFVKEEDAKACLRSAPRLQQQQQQNQGKPAAAGGAKHSVLQDERVDRDGRYTLDGRVLQVAQAVSKTEATQLAVDGPAAQRARLKDKRRLFLLSEGTIAAGSPLHALLPPSEIQMREASARQRQKLIKGNPALHLSLTRLAVRNLPRHVDSKALKELARKAVVGFATDVKAGIRQPLAKEEIARGGQQDREAEHLRRAKGKGVVKQAKVVFETEKGSKVSGEAATAESGGAKSRGYGFIEYWSHRWALTGLRWLNGHAVKSADGRKTHRLIVEFAIENANVVARRRANEEKARAAPRGPRKEGGGGDAEDEEEEEEGFGKRKGSGKFGKDKRKGGKRNKDGEKSETKAGKSAEDADAKPTKKEKADAKLAMRQQIIQRKRMMRKKKGAARRA